MKPLQNSSLMISTLKERFFKSSRMVQIIVVVIIIGISWFGYKTFISNQSVKPQYQTETVEKGTLVVTVTGSGQVSAANSSVISTKATGVVSKVFVKDGDNVKTGDKIAEVDLDLDGKQNATQALASYQGAKNNLAAAKATMYSLQSDMFTNWDKFMTIAQNSTYQNSDGTPNNINRALPEFHIADDNWLATEAKYKNQQNVVIQAQTAMNAAWYSYNQASPVVFSPISGTVSGLSLQPGSVIIASQSNTQNGSTTLSSTKIASIKTDASPTIVINLSEIDIPKVTINDKATVTLDSIAGKTYTGRVISIDSVGTVSSGVTAYATVIKLDAASPDILSNMSAQASIITQIKDDVLLVSASAIQNQNGQSTVRVLKNGTAQDVAVDVGLSSDTQTEITSGLSEGDTVVTSTILPSGTSQQMGQTQSPFSPLGGGIRGGGGFGGGGGGGRR